MSFGGGGGPQPAITPSPVIPVPKFTDADIQTMGAAQRAKFGAGAGRSSTLITGGLGVPNGQVATATPLLGGN